MTSTLDISDSFRFLVFEPSLLEPSAKKAFTDRSTRAISPEWRPTARTWFSFGLKSIAVEHEENSSWIWGDFPLTVSGRLIFQTYRNIPWAHPPSWETSFKNTSSFSESTWQTSSVSFAKNANKDEGYEWMNFISVYRALRPPQPRTSGAPRGYFHLPVPTRVNVSLNGRKADLTYNPTFT